MARKLIHNPNHCPMIHAMNVIGNKWAPIIIYVLGDRKFRFGQLVVFVEGISRKVLTEQLKELELKEVVKRESFAEIPPRVEYSLTERGKELLPILSQLCVWGSGINTSSEKEKVVEVEKSI
ncbi:winged helix-turn-helix transcriptional regulator [Aquimarina sediminis]|uniref:winged helix-turn-helix transcriptional regulator n=1 Tax=Aquimarina sediminis TaxID=2070536 RepID=UPI000CA0426E|nr:helix-turn-helix domain-containing protein [Aquimarina sediminis]